MNTEQKTQTKEAPGTAQTETAKKDNRVAGKAKTDTFEHTMGGATTRDDPTDLGVPMLPGSPKERVMPEDALGEGDKRGDYRDRLGDANYKPHEIKPIDGKIKPGAARVEVVPQAPRTEQIGDVEGKKGGVETDPNFSS